MIQVPRLRREYSWVLQSVGALLLLHGCASHEPQPASSPPDLRPIDPTLSAEPLQLDASQIAPMLTELHAIDLPTVIDLALADNYDILRARQSVIRAEGQLESTVGAVFPAIVPTAVFEHVEGTVRATEGNLVGVGFSTFQPSVAVQWVVNPGRIVYDITAARKRLRASRHQEDAVVQETLRQAVIQYYDLVLNQARVSAEHESVLEAEALLRINRLRIRTGTGVAADELRAEARLAERKQDLIASIMSFYDVSISLATTLRLDAVVTLIPKINELPTVTLVRDDLRTEELLDIAVTFRPDLKSVRELLEAVAADTGATWWGEFGPDFQLGYQYGGITGHADNVVSGNGIPSNLVVNPASPSGSFSSGPLRSGLIKEGILRTSRRIDGHHDQTFSFNDQQRASASVGWRLSVSAFGELKKSRAVEEQARIDARRRIDEVRAQVLRATQAGRAHGELIALAQQQVAAAAEALRLGEANLQAGTMTTLDVLQAQDAATQARLRRAEAVVRFNQSQVNLLAALGLLTREAIR